MLLTARDFLQSVSFPLDWEEVHLQNYLAHWYKQQGYSVRLEVSCQGGRADILADKNGLGMILEVKKWLDRSAILGAYGQGKLYQEHLTLDGIPLCEGGKPRIVVVIGLLTTRAGDEVEQAYRQADRIAASGGVVVFVDQCEDYYPVTCFKSYSRKQSSSGTTVPDDYETEKETDYIKKRENVNTYRTGRVGNSRYRRTRNNHSIATLFAALKALWNGLKRLAVMGWGMVKFCIGLFSPRRKYQRKPKINFLIVYLAIAVLAVAFDFAQRINSTTPTPSHTRQK